MFYTRKCSSCRCYTDSVVITNDGEPYIVCQHCGFVMDAPPEAKDEGIDGKNTYLGEGCKMIQDNFSEIMKMFPAEKPVCFNYQTARKIVMELFQKLHTGRIFNVIINQNNDLGEAVCSNVEMFRVIDDIENPEKAFKEAIDEFCQSDDGYAMISYACGSPNWGDVFSHIPTDYLISRGFSPLDSSIDMAVNHDEIVYRADADEE